MVTLTLATALTSGEYLDITASGHNPASNGSDTADSITVAPGNGTPVTSNAIEFGSSVSDLTVTPSLDVAGATSSYTIDFRATDAVSGGGYPYFTESAGPTKFSTIGGVEVTDNTQDWHFIASCATLFNGWATIPLQDAITAGDSITVFCTDVTNPPAVGEVSDFTAATSGDPWPQTPRPTRSSPMAARASSSR